MKFSSRGDGYQLFLTSVEAMLTLDRHEARSTEPTGQGASKGETPQEVGNRAVLRMRLLNARSGARLNGEGPLPGKANYLIGDDPSKWRTGVETFARVRREGVYPGVDLVYYGNQHELEYDLIVAPRADPRRIKLKFDGAEKVTTDDEGQLLLHVDGGQVVQRKPVLYQTIDGVRHEVAGRYVVNRRGEVTFSVGSYHRSQPLVIDPILSYATYLGGSGNDQANGVAIDAPGNAYVVGQTGSTNFPTSSPLQGTRAGGTDAFVVKLNPSGTGLVYATYLGGAGGDFAYGVAVDAGGNAYVTGMTGSSDFPHSGGAPQPAKSGGTDAFVAKLSASGSTLAYSTFIGGINSETGYGISIDAAGNAYVAGSAASPSINGAALPKHGSPVYKSADAGGTWAASSGGITDVGLTSLTIDPTNSATLYAAGSVVLKSTDGGASWNPTPQLFVSPGFAVTPSSITVDPTAPSIVYAASTFGLFKSTDGGASWARSDNGITFLANMISVLVDPNNAATLYTGSGDGVFKSTTGGANWVAVNTGLGSSPPAVNKLVFDPTNPATLYAATDRGVFKSTNSGSSWSAASTGLPGAPGTTYPISTMAVDPISPGTLYAASFFGGVSKSTDGGRNWNSVSNGLTAAFNGSTYTPQVTGIAINPLAPSTLYAATSEGVYKSSDGGVSWAPSNSGLSNHKINDIVVDRTVPANVYVAASSGADGFAARINPGGTAFDYLVYLGGSENDYARGIAVDPAGNAYIAGLTNSTDFPVSNAAQPSSGGSTDAFVTKLRSDGSVAYSTYLGGAGGDEASAVAVDASGRAYVTGDTYSVNFPTTQTRKQPDTTNLDAFVTRLNASGSSFDYSFLLGGGDADQGFGIAADAAGNAYVTGLTHSADFPTSGGIQACSPNYGSAFTTKLDPASAVVYSTCLGGNGGAQGLAVATDASGAAYVVGITTSPDFPVTAAAPQATYGGANDSFVVRIGYSADLTLSLTGSRDPVMAGNNLIYTLTVTNNGADTAVATKLTDTLPAGVALVSVTPSRGSCGGTGTVRCDLGDIATHATASVAITLTAPGAPATLTNTATATSDTADPNTADNSATLTTSVSALPSIAGRTSLGDGSPIPGVHVTLGGTQTSNQQTGQNGFYEFAQLNQGGSYTVAPSKQGYVFHPQSQSFNNLSADQTADFTGVRCTFALSALNQSFGAAGGAGSVNVAAADSLCQWSARSNVPWITITSGGGAGSGAVTFTVAPAGNSSRSGTLTIAGRTFTVWQGVSPCGAPSFAVAQRIPVAGVTYAFASADFNGDGLPDVALLNDSPRAVAVRLGNGAAGFGPPASYNFAAGWQNHFVSAADLNKDGKPDLVVGNSPNDSSPGSVLVMLNDGAGNFGASQSFPTGADPYGAATADFNGDGNPDLAVVNQGSRNVSLLIGDGAGHFAAPVNFGNFPSPEALAVGDLNGDGKADVVAQGVFGTVVMLGDGQGHLGAQSAYYQPANFDQPGALLVADFNRDGKLDVAAASTQGLGVLLGKGDGTLGATNSISLGIGFNARSIIAGDFNRDGKIDLAATDSTGVTVLTGDGQGGFSPAPLLSTGAFPRALAAGDFNHDGLQDLLTVDTNGEQGTAYSVVLLYGKPSGGFVGANEYPAGANVTAIAQADFNGDGRPDLAFASLMQQGSSGDVSVLNGTGAGNFGAPVSYTVGSNPNSLVVADFNRDGRPDLAAANSGANSVSVLLNNGAGGFAAATSVAVGQLPHTLAVGDFNGDGNPDLAVTDASGGSGHVTVLLGNGGGGFVASGVLLNHNAYAITVADVNGDGRQDMLTLGLNQSTFPNTVLVTYLAGDGVGGFAPPSYKSLTQTALSLNSGLLAGDFNGDGLIDLALDYDGANNTVGGVAVLDGDGQGNFGAPVNYTTGFVPRFLIAGDFNGDGKPDLAVTNWRDYTVSILIGHGTGGFDPAVNYAASSYASAVTTGDFNGDGRDDLAVANYGTAYTTGSVAVMLNACLGASGSSIQLTTPTYSVGEGDGHASLTAVRAGDTSAASSVDYATLPDNGLVQCATNNGAASERCDYTAVRGTVTFAPGETAKTFTVPVTDDSYVEGNETFTVTLSNPTGGSLGTTSSATVTIADNDVAGEPNPIDNSQFFIRQQYLDFLVREPDAGGLQFYLNILNGCGATDDPCIRYTRGALSANFFRSPEFQQKGSFVMYLYMVSLGQRAATVAELSDQTKVERPHFSEFMTDLQAISDPADDKAIVSAKKDALTVAWLQRPEVAQKFGGLSNDQFVHALESTAGVTLANEGSLIAALNNSTMTRAQVLRAVVESPEVDNKFYKQAFVTMEYFGYLRRDPEVCRGSADPANCGYIFHNARFQLSADPDFLENTIVRGFIESPEYRGRYGNN